VDVHVWTTESPVSGVGGVFKHSFRQTTALARVALGAVGPYVFDGQQPPQQPQQQGGDDSDDDEDGHGGGWDDMNGDDSGGEDASAEDWNQPTPGQGSID